jgi:membrane fusion protein (multidrug efflux system)
MKKYLTISLGLLLAACTGGEEKDLAAKKQQLADYKTKAKELLVRIEQLQKEIAKLDTTVKIEQKSKLITVDTLRKQEFKHYIEVQGNVDAAENINALPQQPGIVTAIYVKEGQRVTKGQLLGITETTSTMEAGLQTMQIQLDLATTAFERQKRLWDQKIGSEIQYLQAKTQKEALEKQMAVQRSQVEMTKIKAPISGTVDAVNLRVGEMAIGSQLMPGIRITNNLNLSVKAKLADSEFGKIKEGDKVELVFPDINKTVAEKVTHVEQTIDPRSRTFNVEVKLNNASNEYAANMIAKLRINDAILKNVLLVPSNIIQKSTDGLYVLIAEQNNGIKYARKKSIQTGLEYNGRTVITEGLSEGDNIITFGYSEIVDGQRIEF